MERRTIIIPVNGNKTPVTGKKYSPIRKFLQRHPMIRAFTITVTFAAALALAGALINLMTSSIPGNSSGSNPVAQVPVQVPALNADQGSPTSTLLASSSPPSAQQVPPAAQQPPTPYPDGSCVSGNFSGSTPKDVSEASCSSGQAEYEVIKEFPGATDPSECEGVEGAKFGYLEEYTENGAVVDSVVYCLGDIVK